MELYATGFNAWRQLEFDNPSNPIEEPDDIAEFRSVLKDQSIIGRPCASLSYTLGKSGIPPTQIIDVVSYVLTTFNHNSKHKYQIPLRGL